MKLFSTVLTTAFLFGGAAASAQDAPPAPGGRGGGAEPERRESRQGRVRVQSGPNVIEADEVRLGDVRIDGDVRVHVKRELQKGAYLGVATSPPTGIVREQLKLAQGMGLVVDVVEKESPAEKAGLKQYDVLTKIGDQKLVNAEQLAVLVRGNKPGDEVELTVVRGGAEMKVKAKLVEHELPPLEDILFFRGPGGMNPEHMEAWNRAMIDRAVRELPPGAPRPNVAPLPPQPPRPGAQGDGGGNRVFNSQAVTVWTDGEHNLTITSQAGKPGRNLLAKDKHGAVLYEGDIDAPGEREKLPTIVADKLKKMEDAGVKPPRAPESPKGDEKTSKPNEERDGGGLPTDDSTGL